MVDISKEYSDYTDWAMHKEWYNNAFNSNQNPKSKLNSFYLVLKWLLSDMKQLMNFFIGTINLSIENF